MEMATGSPSFFPTKFVVRNADCHAKNIALFYSSLADVAFTPAYDLVTTQAYPRFAQGQPALSVDGRKTWNMAKSLERFFNSRLGIPPRKYAEMVDMLCESATEVAKEIIEASNNESRWKDVANNMVHAWSDGMISLYNSRSKLGWKGPGWLIAEAQLPDLKATQSEKVIFGRSELLASRRNT